MDPAAGGDRRIHEEHLHIVLGAVGGKDHAVAYFAADEVPYPLEKTKRILRKCTEEECRAAEKIWY